MTDTRSRTTITAASSPLWGARRAVATAAAAALVAVTAAGCVSMDTNLSLDARGNADGGLEAAVDKQAASMLGIASLDSFEQQMTSDLDSDFAESLAGQADMEFSETDTSYVVRANLSGVALTEEDFRAGVDGEQVYFHFENEGDDSGMDLEMGSLTVEVTFPGPVTEVTGAEQVDEDSIRYSGSFSDAVVIDARSDIAAAPVALYVGLGVLGVLLVGGLVTGLVLLSRRKQAATTDPAAAFTEPVTGADEYAGTSQAGRSGQPQPVVAPVPQQAPSPTPLQEQQAPAAPERQGD